MPGTGLLISKPPSQFLLFPLVHGQWSVARGPAFASPIRSWMFNVFPRALGLLSVVRGHAGFLLSAFQFFSVCFWYFPHAIFQKLPTTSSIGFQAVPANVVDSE